MTLTKPQRMFETKHQSVLKIELFSQTSLTLKEYRLLKNIEMLSKTSIGAQRVIKVSCNGT